MGTSRQAMDCAAGVHPGAPVALRHRLSVNKQGGGGGAAGEQAVEGEARPFALPPGPQQPAAPAAHRERAAGGAALNSWFNASNACPLEHHPQPTVSV